MKLKENLKISSDDFWYDLAIGWYIDPYDLCANSEDAEKISKAVELILEFEQSCNEQIDGFEQ